MGIIHKGDLFQIVTLADHKLKLCRHKDHNIGQTSPATFEELADLIVICICLASPQLARSKKNEPREETIKQTDDTQLFLMEID